MFCIQVSSTATPHHLSDEEPNDPSCYSSKTKGQHQGEMGDTPWRNPSLPTCSTRGCSDVFVMGILETLWKTVLYFKEPQHAIVPVICHSATGYMARSLEWKINTSEEHLPRKHNPSSFASARSPSECKASKAGVLKTNWQCRMTINVSIPT